MNVGKVVIALIGVVITLIPFFFWLKWSKRSERK